MQGHKEQANHEALMDHPFARSTPTVERVKRLFDVVDTEDVVAVLINADPDSMASAMALKRLFWRRVKRVSIYHINPIRRADNLAFVRRLRIDQQPISKLSPSKITKWAIVDSQPHHNEQFAPYPFDIIIDHHPVGPEIKAQFVEIKEDYGANSTIMTEYLRAAKIKPSPRLATALFFGIKTDTDNFVRESLANDVNAFRYLYQFTNMNIIKKIESSEMTRKTLASYQLAIERVRIFHNTAVVYMDEVQDPDILVMIADFFMKLAEATWSISAGIWDETLIVIFRNAGFRGNAGKVAEKIFGHMGGSAGGHKGAARAEIPLEIIKKQTKGGDIERFLLSTFRGAL
ncbi:MAG TPA: exopolyphosphatase [Desulfobacterales bacterium]|nr:exopolyphosphatase [Desulfobacterales bacterium]